MRCEDCKDRDWCVMMGEQGSWCEHMRKMEPVEPPRLVEMAQHVKHALWRIAEKIRARLHSERKEADRG